MNLNRILRHVRNSWRTLAACVLAGLLLGGLATLIQRPSYEASATVLVSPNRPLGTFGTALGADAALIQQRAQSYVTVATSLEVLGPAAERAGLAELLDSSVTVEWLATAPANLEISVTQPSADDAAAAANAVAGQLSSVVARLEQQDRGGPIVKLTVARTAEPPDSPVSPDLPVYLLLGFVAGLAVGFPVVLARLLLNRGVSDGPALEEATGEAPLGVIGATATDTALILRDAPHSMPAEAFRKLRTSVQFAKPGFDVSSIVVTAPHLGAGTTTVAVNLALATAEAGRRVLLVDANLRDPAVAGLLGLDARAGLIDVLGDDLEVKAAVRPGGVPDLIVLTAGQVTGEPSGLLAGPGMAALLERAEALAALVIIDAPPVLPYAEAAELAAIADATVLVARHGQTTVDDLQEARATLAQVGTTVLGVVINGVPQRGRAADTGANGSAGGPKPRRGKSESPEPELADQPSR